MTSTSCAILNNNKNETKTSLDVHQLEFEEWEPSHDFSHIIVKVHGYNDYSNSFEVSGKYFANHGIKSISFDLNGFGKNTNKGEWFGLDSHIRDISIIIKKIKLKYPRKKIFLMGESMGGAIVISIAEKQKEIPIDGLILVAPALWNFTETNFIKSLPLKLMSKVLPKLQVDGKGLVKVRASNNDDMLKKLSEDKYFIHKPSLESLQGVIDLMDESFLNARKYLEDPPFKTLILIPLKDEIVPRKPLMSIISDLNRKNNFLEKIKINLYTESFHMILRDLQGVQIINDIKDWVLDGLKNPKYNNESILKQLEDATFVHRLD